MRKKLGICLGLLLLLTAALAGCGPKQSAAPAESSAAAVTEQAEPRKLTVKMLDVGQGDAILIETGEQTVLIDSSDIDEREKLRAELKEAGVTKLDKVILTHPHADHIGGMDVLLKEFKVGEVYDNGMPSTSKLYLGYMKELKKQEIKRHGLKAGEVLELGNGAIFKVLAPSEELVANGTQQGYKHDPNNESVVGQLIFGDFKMMFTGDAEATEEKAILASFEGMSLQSQVLKSGHHGSKTSSSKEWLRALEPETALISCGEGNDYGHPNKETMKKYQVLKMKVYETDKNGTITLVSDGKGYEISVEKGDVQ